MQYASEANLILFEFNSNISLQVMVIVDVKSSYLHLSTRSQARNAVSHILDGAGLRIEYTVGTPKDSWSNIVARGLVRVNKAEVPTSRQLLDLS